MTASIIKTLVTAIENKGMAGLIESATSLYQHDVSQRLHYKVFAERTDRAAKPLVSLDEAVYYSSTFTKEHFDRFYHVLNNLGTKAMFAQRLAVIDYGCGQGLAALTFLHYLHKNNCIANKVVEVHLVEPSAITLALARQFVLAMAKYTGIRVNVSVHQKTLAQYLAAPIVINQEDMTLHFLSNVLDIKGIESSAFALSKHINAQAGEHFICAVSPYKGNGFRYFYTGLSCFDVDCEQFELNSHRFNSNRHQWDKKTAAGESLYAQKAA